jgi:hypothetical protein
VLSLKLQIACLVSDEEEEQEHDEGEEQEQEQEEEQEEEQGQQEEAGEPISKWDIVTNRSHRLKYKNGNDQFKKIRNQTTGRGNYYGKPLGKKLYAHAAALSPQNAFKNLEMISALNQAAFLVDSGIGISSINLKKDCQDYTLCLNTEGLCHRCCYRLCLSSLGRNSRGQLQIVSAV